MKRSLKRNVLSVFVGGIALLALAALGIGSIPWISHAAEEAKEEKAEPEKPKEEKPPEAPPTFVDGSKPTNLLPNDTQLVISYPMRKTPRSWRRTTLIS